MNIKQHIEAGHYPKDEHGMELVQTSRGLEAKIADVHPDGRIAGWPAVGGGRAWTWSDSGAAFQNDSGCLLPPSPRKVEVNAWGVFCGTTMQSSHHSESAARNAAYSWESMWKTKPAVVELTGSYEEPWS